MPAVTTPAVAGAPTVLADQSARPAAAASAPVGIERKTLTDFFSSMVKKRLFEQVHRLRDAYPQPLLILEGDLTEISTFRHPQSILGALLVIETAERVPVLP